MKGARHTRWMRDIQYETGLFSENCRISRHHTSPCAAFTSIVKRCKTAHLHQSTDKTLYGKYYHTHLIAPELFETGNSNFLCASIVTLRRLSFYTIKLPYPACVLGSLFTLLGFLRTVAVSLRIPPERWLSSQNRNTSLSFYYRLVCWSVLLLRLQGSRHIVRISLRHHKT